MLLFCGVGKICVQRGVQCTSQVINITNSELLFDEQTMDKEPRTTPSNYLFCCFYLAYTIIFRSHRLIDIGNLKKCFSFCVIHFVIKFIFAIEIKG